MSVTPFDSMLSYVSRLRLQGDRRPIQELMDAYEDAVAARDAREARRASAAFVDRGDGQRRRSLALDTAAGCNEDEGYAG